MASKEQHAGLNYILASSRAPQHVSKHHQTSYDLDPDTVRIRKLQESIEQKKLKKLLGELDNDTPT